MKTKSLILCMGIACILLVLSSCCDDDDNTKEVVCEKGFEPVNDSCVCPSGKFEAYGNCLELGENEWIGITTGCPCLDTIFFKIKKIEGEAAEVQLNEDIILDIEDHPFYLLYFIGGTFDLEYHQLPGGDSLASRNNYNGYNCLEDYSPPYDYWVNMFGRISDSGDTIRLKLVFRDLQVPGIIVDSCHVVFHK